uniref:Uncharacterized protein n=1 Tax=Sphaerodactylus townsendi TaxID=933632 RepID=A0ACB8FFJ8_9SAUR
MDMRPETFEGRPLEREEVNMAAKQHGNRKTTKMKANLQKRHQAAMRKHKRLQSKKQKKRQASEAGWRPILSPSFLQMFVPKFLQLIPEVRMENKAWELMKTCLMDRVPDDIEHLIQNSKLAALDPAMVEAVLMDALTRELEKHSAEPETAAAA